MPHHEHNVSRGHGDGAGEEIEDMYDGEEYETKDQRSPKRTTYYESDIYKHCTDGRHAFHLRRAMKYQEGQQVDAGSDAKPRSVQNHEEDQRRMIGTICSQLDMTPAQKKRVRHLVMDVISVNSFGQYSSEQVILAVINVVAREDERLIEDEDAFMQYMIDVGITTEDGNADKKTMRRLRRMVRERTPR